MALITELEKTAIESAIRELETRTTGELVCVIASSSDSYRYIPLLWSALLALAALPVAELLFPLLEFTYLYAIQLVVFMGSWSLLRLPQLRRLIIPTAVQHRRASRMAHEAFIHLGIHNTTHRAGLLLFVSEEEHYVELVADKGIAEQAGNDTWKEAIDLFIADIRQGNSGQGFIDCIKRCGNVLIEKFPLEETSDREQLPDVLLEIEHDYFD